MAKHSYENINYYNYYYLLGLLHIISPGSFLIFFLQALSVATNAENQSKNGSDSVIPYDRNRVILTPDGARPHSTYINASFIEGYFNDESFIITQDPLKVNY